MAKQTTHLPVVRQWCQSLGVLSAVSISRQEAEMKLAAYVPLLFDRFPDAAFTTASLEHVAARAVKGFPTYGELAAWLSEWWSAHRPALPALPPPDIPPPRPPPTPEEVAYVHQRVAECVAAMRSSAIDADTVGRSLDEALTFRPRPRYLTPEQLDRINPLPNGRKRSDAATSPAAHVDPAPDADASTATEATAAS